MFENAYLDRQSIIHGLDPRLKLVITSLFSVIVALSHQWQALAVALATALSWTMLARLPLIRILGRLLVVNFFLVILWAMLVFSVPGQGLLKLGPLIATKEGIAYGGLIWVRSNTIVICLMALVGTTPIFSLGRAMGHLGVPRKLVHLLLFTYRYIHVIETEYHRLMNALKVRGFEPRTNMHTYKTYAYLIGMLLVKSYERSERVRKAMLARGFQGRYPDLWTFTLTGWDLVAGSMMLLQVITIAVLQWTKIAY